MRKSSAGKGTWYRLRHAQGSEVWVGTAHFTPGVSQNAHAVEVHAFFEGLPATQLPVLLGCDLNSRVNWFVDGSS